MDAAAAVQTTGSSLAEARARGRDARRRGDHVAALDWFREAAGVDDADAQLWQDVGSTALTLGRLDEAIEAYETALALEPGRVDVLRGLGYCARRRGDMTAALRWFEAACDRAPVQAKHHQEVGEALRGLGRLPEAALAFERAIALEPQHRPALLALAGVARTLDDDERALACLTVAAAAGPPDSRVERDMAGVLCRLARYDAAEAAYRAVIERDPECVDARRGLAVVARARGDRRAALAFLIEAAERRDDPGLALEIAGEKVALGGDVEAAYTPLLAREDTRHRACVALAREAERVGDAAQALSWREAAWAAAPHLRDTGLALAEAYRSVWDLSGAEATLAALGERFPDDVTVLTTRGHLARTRGQREAARRFFEEAYRLDPVSGAMGLALDLRENGAHERARDILERLRLKRPDDASVVVQLGLTARAVGSPADAMALYDEAIRIAPAHMSAAVEKAAMLQDLGRIVEARVLLEEVLARYPGHARASQSLADLALSEDDAAGALLLLRRAVEANPGLAALRLQIARCETALGQIEAALATLDNVLAKRGASPDAYLLKAQIFRQQGRIDEAAEAFARATTAYPQSFLLWLQRALFTVDTRGEVGAVLDPTHAPASTARERTKASIVPGAAAAADWDFAAAQRHLEAALDGNEGDNALRTRLATVALLNLDLPGAEHHLRKLAALEAPARRLRGQSLGAFHTLSGQILDEARIDATGLGRLVESAGVAPPQRFDALAAVVRDHPDMTLAGMQLMLTLRRDGAFDHAPHRQDGAAIPLQIVQFWHGEAPPPDVLVLIRTWAERNPDCGYRLFSGRDAYAFLSTQFTPVVAEAYRLARDPARKADIFRLAYLLRCGGLYADADDRCVAPISGLLTGATMVLYQEDVGSIGNNVMAAAPGHPALRRALNLAVASVTGGDSDIAWLSTGPGLITRVLAQLTVEGGPSMFGVGGIRVLSRRALLPFVAVGCMTAYKHTRRHWSRAAFLAPAVRQSPGAVPPPTPSSPATP